MPGVRVVGQKVIAEGGSGPIKAVWTAHGSAMALFSTKERNDLMRESLNEGGLFWAIVFLPMRFSEYARKLGYNEGAKYAARKQRLGAGTTPLVYTGTLRKAAIEGASVTTRATTGKQTIIVKIPIGDHGATGKNGKRQYGINKVVTATLRTIPQWEVKRVAAEVEKALVRFLEGKLAQRMATPTAPPVQTRATTSARTSQRGRAA